MDRYVVIKYFTDLQDNSHPYNAGDTFPRKGLVVSEQRLKELSGSNNRQNTPLIKIAPSRFLGTNEVVDALPPDNSEVVNNEEEKPKTSRKRRK